MYVICSAAVCMYIMPRVRWVMEFLVCGYKISLIFNRELASAVLKYYLLLGICQQVFQLDICMVQKAHRGIPKHPKVSHSIPKF